MTVTETSLYEYHTQEWEAFANQQYDDMMFDWDEDDDSIPDRDDYITELAQSYWDEFENEASVSLSEVYQDIHYSAGVYLGEIDDNNITDRIIYHDQTFYGENDEEFKPEVDMVEVTLMNSNPDLYGDECEKFISKILFELAEQKMLQMLVEVSGKESLGKYITSEMGSRRPELIEVLLEWNQDLTHDQVLDFMSETNNGGIVAFFESHGIDF